MEKLRGELENASVNIVMLTPESSPSMKERGNATGVKVWIVKPFIDAAVIWSFASMVWVWQHPLITGTDERRLRGQLACKHADPAVAASSART